MARQASRIGFDGVGALVAHLDRWAAGNLKTADQWADALTSSTAWLGYSPRNQVLLASYGVTGLVAGAETWRLVPSTHEGRVCAVRAGEHGYPVRVPITPSAPSGAPTAMRPAERFEWRAVFAIDQLARRPAPDALRPVDVPPGLMDPEGLRRAARQVAAATVRGRAPKADPAEVLLGAATRLRRSSKRPALNGPVADQAVWLVLDRIGQATRPTPPPFDPSGLRSRERWERLQDVLDTTRRLTAGLGAAVDVDLTASPLPRMALDGDRSPQRRLPRAELAHLPIGRWHHLGPYTAVEWEARGETGVGTGAVLRLNQTAYLAAVETGDGATWRLVDADRRTGAGHIVAGTSDTLSDARHDAVTAVADRYPALSPDVGPQTPGAIGRLWEPMPGEGTTSAKVRHLGDDVTLSVMPGPGGRWMPSVWVAGEVSRLPLTKTEEEARAAAELAGRRVLAAGRVIEPPPTGPSLDERVGLVVSGGYSREALAPVVDGHLDPPELERLTSTDDPREMAEALGRAGLGPRLTVEVLRVEEFPADQVAGVIPTLGITTADGITALRDGWNMTRADAAQALGATAAEMRDAGCSPREIMAARPRDVLRSLPEDPHLWQLAATTMSNAGHDHATVAAHLVGHAPTPAAFAAGLTSAIEDPRAGIGAAVQRQAAPEHLAAAASSYGLSPEETGNLLLDVGCAAATTLDALTSRCDGDTDGAAEVGSHIGIGSLAIETWRHPAATVISRIPGSDDLLGPEETAALLAALPSPQPPSRAADLVVGLDPT
jgi:hypothetical protein